MLILHLLFIIYQAAKKPGQKKPLRSAQTWKHFSTRRGSCILDFSPLLNQAEALGEQMTFTSTLFSLCQQQHNNKKVHLQKANSQKKY
jgi:hypothetical protein